jgi:hypothetical protein
MNKRRRNGPEKKLNKALPLIIFLLVHDMIEKQKENCNDSKNEKVRRVDERKQRRSNRYRF